jgi:hypothetical protein
LAKVEQKISCLFVFILHDYVVAVPNIGFLRKFDIDFGQYFSSSSRFFPQSIGQFASQQQMVLLSRLFYRVLDESLGWPDSIGREVKR